MEVYPGTKPFTFHSTAVATGNGNILDVKDSAAVIVQITGTFVGTIAFKGSVNDSDYDDIQAVKINNGSVAVTATVTGLYYVPTNGLSLLMLPLTWTSGTSITVVGRMVSIASGVSLADVDVAGAEVVTLGAGTATYGKGRSENS